MAEDSKKDQSEDSLKKRYFYKLVTNTISIFTNVVVQAILPRALGPVLYGNFSYLIYFFGQVFTFVDSSSTVGLLVKTSQRRNELKLVSFYFLYFVTAVTILFLGIWSLGHSQWREKFWPEQEMIYVYYACIYAAFAWLNSVFHSLCDSYGFTVLAERLRLGHKIFSGLLILALFLFGWLDFDLVFYYYFLTLGLMAAILLGVLVINNKWPRREDWTLQRAEFNSYVKEFWEYCAPIFVLFAVQSAVLVFDRWLLQIERGSAEQGYFSFTYQVGTIAFLFTSAIAPLFQREFSVAFKEKNIARCKFLFERYLPPIFALSCFFSLFVMFEAERIVEIFAGDEYLAAIPALKIMAFYPPFITLTTIFGAIFFSASETKSLRNLCVLIFLGSTPLSFLLIGGSSLGGLDMGMLGLAYKVVFSFLVLSIAQLAFLTRLIKVRFWKQIVRQTQLLALFLALGWVSHYVSCLINDHLDDLFFEFLISGSIYLIFVSALAWLEPALFGLQHRDVRLIFNILRRVTPGVKVAPEPDKSKALSIALLGDGASIHTIKWANSMVEKGHKVHLITMHNLGKELSPKVHTHRLLQGPPLGYLTNFIQLKTILRKNKVDLLHVHYVSGYGLLGTLSGLRPRILSVWGDDVTTFAEGSLVKKILLRNSLARSTWVCATSEALGEEVLKRVPEVEYNLSTVPFGVDVSRFSEAKAQRDESVLNIGTVKALYPTYGIDLLIDAFTNARQQILESDVKLGESLRLVIVGDGSQRLELEQRCKDLGIWEVTRFVGRVQHGEVPKYLKKLDIYVALSRSESFGVAIVEASAAGLPVLVSDVGGLPEVVDQGDTGFLVDISEPLEAKERLVELIKSRELRTKMGAAGYKKVRDIYEWETCVEQMEALYYEVMKM